MTFFRRRLQKTHANILERRQWYRRWHEMSYHRHVHYAVAHLVGWPLVAVLVVSIFATAASINIMWQTQQVRAADQTWSTYSDFNEWTKTDVVATASGSLSLSYTVGDASAVATITGFTQAHASAVAASGMVYTADSNGYALRKINPATNAVIQSFDLASTPRKLITASNGHIYTVAGSYLYDLDPATDTLSGPFTVDADSVCWGIAQAPNGYLYITALSSSRVSVVDPTSHAVVATIPSGVFTRGIAITDAGILYVGNVSANTITVIDTSDNTVIQTLTGFSSPSEIAIPDSGYIYVGNSGTHQVLKLDPTDYSVVATIAVGQTPAALAVDTNGQIWVANMYSHNIMRINPSTDTVTATVATSNNPWSFGFGADGDIYVGNMAAGTVNRVDTGVLSYGTNGTATTSFTPLVGQNNSWSIADASMATPTGTAVALAYSADNTTWKDDITQVPSSETLYVRASFTSSDSSVSAALNALTITYSVAEAVGGEDPVGNTETPVTNTATNTTTTTTTTTSNTATNTADATVEEVVDEDAEVVVVAVPKPQNVQAYAGVIGTTLTFTPPPAGHRIIVWRSLDEFSDGLKIESTDQGQFNDYDAKPGLTNRYYYKVETFRQSDGQLSDPVRISTSYPAQYAYGISIGTHNVTLKAGESKQLTATVYDGSGQVVNTPVTWSVPDAAVGSITSDGVFTAGQTNGFWAEGIKATVSSNGLGGEAMVSVAIDQQGSVVAAVSLSPDSITLKPGQTQDFRLYLIDQYGARTLADQTKVAWSTTVGTMAGSVLTAGTEEKMTNDGVVGIFTDVSGQVWRVQARVTVSTETPYLQRVTMTGTRRLATGSTTRYTSSGYDQFNNYLGARAVRSFQSSDTAVATIDPVGNVHVGDLVGCYYWMLRGNQTYDGRSEYALSGLITRPYTDAQMATIDQSRYAAWRQVKYVFKPGEKYQFIASVYDGWGLQAPGEYAVFEMADGQAGSITANGYYTASTANGLYNAAINVYFQSTRTGERRLGQTIKLAIANEDQVLGNIETVSVKTLSNWHWVTGARLYNQFGLAFTNPFRFNWTLTGGNSSILQNGLINTGDAETSNSVIDVSITAGGVTKQATTRGNLVSSDTFTLGGVCAPPTTPGTGGTITGPDGEELIIDNESWSETVNPPIVDIVEDRAPVDIVQTAKRAQTAIVPVTAIALIGALPAVLSTVFQVAGEAVTRTSSSLLGLLQIFGLSRRNVSYGLVTTGRRRRPVAGALVELLSPSDRSVIETQHTDSAGRFVCLQDKPIPYILRVSAAGLKTLELRVTGATIHRPIRLDVASEADHRAMVRHQLWSKLSSLLVWFSLALLVVGTVLWFIVIRRDGLDLLLTLLGAYYTLAWVLEYYIITLPRPFGDLKDAVTGQPLPFVVVTLLSSGKVVSREVTNQRGRYRALIRPGVYDLTFTRAGYQSVVKKGLVVTKKSGAVGLQVKLKPLS